MTAAGLPYLISMALVLAVLAGAAWYGYQRWQPVPQDATFEVASAESHLVKLPPCTDTDTRERIRALAFEGLDNAFRDRVEALYAVWMRDETSQPDRARVGVQQSIRAYLEARKLVDNWSPTLCAG